MTGRDLLKRTPVRIAALFTALFTLTVTTLFTILFLSVEAELEGLIRQRVVETQDALAAVDADNGFESLVGVVTSEASSVRDADSIFLLVDEAGAFRAGNVRDIPQFEDWRFLRRSELPSLGGKGEATDRFLVGWKDVSKGRVLVGFSDREVRETQRLLLHGLGWGLGITAVLAALFGTYLARQAQRRIGAFSGTLTAVSQGAVNSRVPLAGSGDDMDRIAEQINRTLGHLQRLIENVNQASSDIAHDLKKPIGRLRQQLDHAQRTAASMDDYRTAVDSALGDLDAITETFEALLRIAQIEAGTRKKRFAPLDLRDVLSDVTDAYGAVVEDAGDTIAFVDKVDGAARIRGDKELLTQLFANLIENAIRHCPRGTRITLSLAQRADTYVVAVADTGPGIPAEERENVLRRLYRLEAARSTPGSGLGLSLVAAVAELHDAKLMLGDNDPGLRVEVAFARA